MALTAAGPVQASDGGRLSIQRMVVAEARNMGIPPGLALAVAQAESDFNPRVLSHKGARGVMQIMPRTAWEEYGIAPDQLWQPRINIRLGLHFLKRLLHRYRGRVDLPCPTIMAVRRSAICPGPGLFPPPIPMCARLGNFG